MPWKDLGKVAGEDGRIGNVDSTYINNGGDPGVTIVRSGEESAPDFTFEFENLVNDPLGESELEAIVNGETVMTSNVVNGTVLSSFFSALKDIFAAKEHEHSAADLTSGTLDMALIKDGSIPSAKFDQATRDSLSLSPFVTKNVTASYNIPASGTTSLEYDAPVIPGYTLSGVATWNTANSWVFVSKVDTSEAVLRNSDTSSTRGGTLRVTLRYDRDPIG